MVQPLWKTEWRFLRELKIKLLYEPAIPRLDIYPKKTKTLTGFPGASAGEESACGVGDLGWIPGLGRFPREGKGYPLQYSGLENSMDYIVHGGHKESDMTE